MESRLVKHYNAGMSGRGLDGREWRLISEPEFRIRIDSAKEGMVALSRVYIILAVLLVFLPLEGRAQPVRSSAGKSYDGAPLTWFVQSGHMELSLSADAMSRLGWQVVAHKTSVEEAAGNEDGVYRFPVDLPSNMNLDLDEGTQAASIAGRRRTTCRCGR